MVLEGYDPENIFFSLELDLDSDIMQHNRSVYTFLDYLGDVGGLFDALKGIFSLVVTFYFSLFGSPLKEFLLKSLFLKDPEPSH